MSRTVTRAELRTAAYQRGDFETKTTRFPSADLNAYINQSVSTFQNFLIGAWGTDPFETDYAFSTTAGVATYAAPSDIFQLIRIELNPNNGNRRQTLTPAGRHERAWLRDGNANHGAYPLHYAYRGSNIELLPTPAAVYSMTLEYVPATALLANDSATLDGVNGWDEWVAVDVARKMATKDADWALVAELRNDLKEIESRIRAMAPARDRGERRVVDVIGMRRRA